MSQREIPIWFFIGLSLLINGVLITGAGIWEFMHPSATHVVLYQLHANIWWGAILLVLGIFYCIKFSPRKA